MEETRDNADILMMKAKGGAESSDADEIREMRDRMHLLTEEN